MQSSFSLSAIKLGSLVVHIFYAWATRPNQVLIRHHLGFSLVEISMEGLILLAY
jgi:hypothetical protein